MASTRAEEVAEVLWELKRADKVATMSAVANRAGFSAGSSGRAIKTAIKTVRRDWPHLQWWRAVPDDGAVEKGSEHETFLADAGYEIAPEDDETVKIVDLDEKVMSWESESADETAE